jgi:uncharacterized membrane protein
MSMSALEQTAPLAVDVGAGAGSARTGRAPRVVGVDVARGLALIGMMATHAFGSVDDHDNPTLAHLVAGGRAATTFVVVAGVSLAFLSGGRRPVRGRERLGASAGLAVRALLIGALGLALGYLAELSGTLGILPFYGLLFLLAIPLLGCAPLVLLGIAAALIVVGPLLIVVTADAGLPGPGSEADPTFGTLVHDPVGLLAQLFLTGEYPAVVYLAYLCVGLAIGRLDLRSRRLGWWLLAGGAASAIAARVVSALLLDRMGGLARLVESGDLADDPAGVTGLLLGEAGPPTSWWYLALPTPHSHTPVDLLHTLGCAAAVLGAALLVARVPAVARVLSPLVAAGTMSLTLYSSHLVFLATGVLDGQPALLFLAMTVAALLLAWAWRRRLGQGPLEKLVAVAATAARRAVARPRTADGQVAAAAHTGRPPRTGARRAMKFGTPVATAGLLALTFWSGAAFAVPPGTNVVAATASDLSEDSEEPEFEAGGPAPAAPDAAAQPDSPVIAAAPQAETAVIDARRYCRLSAQLYAVEEAHPDQPIVIVEKAGAQLGELPQVAPVEIRDAVTTIVTDYHAEANTPGVAAPSEAKVAQAETTVEVFEDRHC